MVDIGTAPDVIASYVPIAGIGDRGADIFKAICFAAFHLSSSDEFGSLASISWYITYAVVHTVVIFVEISSIASLTCALLYVDSFFPHNAFIIGSNTHHLTTASSDSLLDPMTDVDQDLSCPIAFDIVGDAQGTFNLSIELVFPSDLNLSSSIPRAS